MQWALGSTPSTSKKILISATGQNLRTVNSDLLNQIIQQTDVRRQGRGRGRSKLTSYIMGVN
jgi:hypothetical protein